MCMNKITNNDLKNFLESGYVKEGWLDNINDLISNDILECINHCKSPTGKDKCEKLKAIFRAFSLFPLSKTQVLILGQDPYTAKSRKADGCAFSVANGKKDASLLNIFKAAKASFDKNKKYIDIDKNEVNGWNYDLKFWASQNNVLLLNTALTHESTDRKMIENHIKKWEPFIQEIIRKLITNNNKLVIFLWGKNAQQTFYKYIDNTEYKNTFLNNLSQEEKNKLKNKNVINKKFPPININKNEIKILMTSHPSNQGVQQGFSDNAPEYFRVCNKFLGKNIWSDLSKG